jgi:hypothetical protein
MVDSDSLLAPAPATLPLRQRWWTWTMDSNSRWLGARCIKIQGRLLLSSKGERPAERFLFLLFYRACVLETVILITAGAVCASAT